MCSFSFILWIFFPYFLEFLVYIFKSSVWQQDIGESDVQELQEVRHEGIQAKVVDGDGCTNREEYALAKQKMLVFWCTFGDTHTKGFVELGAEPMVDLS